MRGLSRTLSLFVCGVVLSSVAFAAEAQQVWAEGGVASILAGADDRGRPIYRKFYVAAVGPMGDQLGSGHPEFRECARQVLATQAEAPAWWEPVDREVATPYEIAIRLSKDEQVSAEAIFRERAEKRERVRMHFVELRHRVISGLRQCGPKRFIEQIRIGLVNRVCTAQEADSCKAFPSNYERLQFQRYAKVFDWYQTAGVREANDVVEITSQGLISSIPVSFEQQNWPKAPSAEEAQKAFERATIKLRGQQKYFSYIAPRAIGLRKETAERLIDVIDHPIFSLPELVSDPSKPALLTLQDEIARSRIVQCVVYHAHEKVPGCAGYKLDEKSIAHCLNGLECLPDIDTNSLVHSVQVTAPRTLRQLPVSQLPRWTREIPDEDLRKFVEECRRSASLADATVCVMRKTFAPDAQQAFDCAVAAAKRGQGGTQQALRCLAKDEPEQYKTVLACADKRPSSSLLMECLVNSQLSEPDQRLLGCLRKMNGADASAAAQCFAQKDKRLSRLIECNKKHGSDREALALCVLAAKGVPEEAAAAINCARKHNNDLQKIGGCLLTQGVIGNKIGGDLGRGINCFASSGGSTIGTAACMSGPKVRAEQQIALECISQSADIASYEGCVGGKLTMKELGQCRNIEYGKPGCYGPNNEIQKFLSAVGINTGERTVVGRVAKLNVKIATAQLAVAEDVLVKGVRFVGDVSDFVEGFGKTAEKAAKKVWSNTAGRLERGVKKALRL